jgi:Zn-dependent M32 family carboxypeptidase
MFILKINKYVNKTCFLFYVIILLGGYMENYKKLLEYIREITNLECIYSTLDWDMRISAPKDSKDYIISLEGDIADKIFNR